MGPLAPAVKDTKESPSKNGVTAPTDAKFKAVDVDRKMAFYGVIEAFRAGKYPSNKQIDETLEYTLANSPIPLDQLSPDGRKLVEDFRDVIRTAKKIVGERNRDELFQNFLYHTRQVDYSQGDLSGVKTPGKEDFSKDGQQAAEHLRTLAKLIFTNSEFRKLLKDAGILGRDIAADAASKIADVARPHEDHLRQIDEPAPSNQWVGPNGEVRGAHEAVPDTGLAAKRDTVIDAKDKAASAVQDSANKVASAADQAQQGQANGAIEGAVNANGDVSQAHKDAAADEASARASAAQSAGFNAAKDQAEKLKTSFLSKIPDHHKENAKEQLENAKNYAKDKFPQERRDRFIYRLKKVVVESQRHRDYQDAVEFFIGLAETYHGHAASAASQSGDKGLAVRNDPAFKQAENELRTLLERFANGQSMQPIFNAIEQLYTDASNDSELKQWFRDLDKYVRRALIEPGYIMKDESDAAARQLSESSKKFWDPKQGKYAGHKDRFFETVQTFFTSYADDPLNVALGENVKKLTKDLLYDADGGLKYKPHLWQDIRSVILPSLAQHIGYVPIPRIEYVDPQLEIVIENLTLESQNLLPNIIEFEAKNYFKTSPYAAVKDVSKHSFQLGFSHIQADLRNVAFYYKKKTGFPKISDHGLADVFIGGKGISGKIHLESTSQKHHVFKVVDVKVKIDTLKFAIHGGAKHSFLYATVRPLANNLIKKQIAKAIQDGIHSSLVQLDAQLSDISERAEEIKGQAKSEEPVSAIDAFKNAYNDKKAEAERAKAKVEANKPSGTFKLVAKRESKIIDWSSKDSFVEKQGAKEDAVKSTGSTDGWKSEAFTIV